MTEDEIAEVVGSNFRQRQININRAMAQPEYQAYEDGYRAGYEKAVQEFGGEGQHAVKPQVVTPAPAPVKQPTSATPHTTRGLSARPDAS